MGRGALFALGLLVLTVTPARAEDCVGPFPGPRSLLKSVKVVFVGTAIRENTHTADYTLRGTHTFRVTESFKGVKGQYINVEALPWGNVKFQVGQQYLVFADSCPWGPQDRSCLATIACSGILPLEYAPAIIEQLRAEKRGEPVASVYGMMWRSFENEGIWEERHDYPMPNVVVRLSNGKKSFITKTDDHGAYAFQELPKGTYEVSADLPTGLAVAQLILHDPPPPFELPARSSYEYNLYVRPTALISGRVIGPDDQPLPTAEADLYLLNRYKEGDFGMRSYQGRNTPRDQWKPFTFYHLPPGDYVLVFNPENKELPDEPFPRTFYPAVADLVSSQIIHLAAGQQILNADIHVSHPLPTRQIIVRLAWDGRAPENFFRPYLSVKASRGAAPSATPTGQDTYTLNLMRDAQYTIQAKANCRSPSAPTTETDAATVDGSDLSASIITLTFDKGECTPK